MSLTIALQNVSTVAADADVAAIAAALQIQVTRDAAPIWDLDPSITIVALKAHDPVPVGAWLLVILDDSDQADALGYHDLTAEGLPMGKVFARSDLQAGAKLSVTISHELLEMLVDPYICWTAEDQQDSTGATFYALEVCDACEDDSLGYDINGITVSDFVTPAWFDNSGGPYDFGKHITAAAQILVNGYIGIWTPTTGWQQKTSQHASLAAHARAPIGSRRERRRTPRSQWRRSVAA